MPKSRKKSPLSWHALAKPTASRRALWNHGDDRTYWAACGWAWDAVAITPLSLGLDALAAMQLAPRSGYPVLADRLRDTLYVMVPLGTGASVAAVPGVRVLSAGRQLLLPRTAHGTPCAHWVSAPGEDWQRLVGVDQLTTHLQELTCTHERAAAS